MRNHQATVLEAIRKHKGKISDESLMRATGLDRLALSSAVGALRRRGIIAYEKINPTKADWSTIRIVEPGEAQQLVAETHRAKVPTKTYPLASVVEEPAPSVHRAYVDTSGLSRVRDLLSQAAEELGAIVGGALGPAEYLRALASQLEVAPAPPVTVTVAAPAAKVARARKPKAEGKPRFKTVGYRTRGGEYPDLAEFCELEDARKAWRIDPRARTLVEIATGKVIETKRSPLSVLSDKAADEEE